MKIHYRDSDGEALCHRVPRHSTKTVQPALVSCLRCLSLLDAIRAAARRTK